MIFSLNDVRKDTRVFFEGSIEKTLFAFCEHTGLTLEDVSWSGYWDENFFCLFIDFEHDLWNIREYNDMYSCEKLVTSSAEEVVQFINEYGKVIHFEVIPLVD
jgi:hypothetical protein